MTKKIRNNDYYLQRLEREHPTIFADWKSGKYASARQALRAAGLKHDPDRVKQMKNAWSKLTTAEQRNLLSWISATSSGASALSGPTRHSTVASIIHAERKLLPGTIARIQLIMGKRGLKMGQVMREMGLKPLNASLGRALVRPTVLDPNLINALEKWLRANRAV